MKRMKISITALVCVLGLLLTAGFTFAGDWQDGSPNANNTSYMYGNVGIGTTNPGARLEIQGTNPFIAINMGDSSTNQYANLKWNTDSGNAQIWRSGTAYTGWGGALALNLYNSNGPIAFHPNGNSNAVYFAANGNLGIGTTNPGARLEIQGTNPFIAINMGDGSTSQYANLKWNTDSGNAQIWRSGTAYTGWGGALALNLYNSNGPIAFHPNGNSNAVYFTANGNVGIGTTTPDNKLDVKGTIRAEEVKVETGWSDFVFDNRYNLPDLEQVESYIKDNKHLPDIPSAKEIEEEGLSMAKMMAKQMQKIEELTLYVIEQNKEIKELKKKLAELEKSK